MVTFIDGSTIARPVPGHEATDFVSAGLAASESADAAAPVISMPSSWVRAVGRRRLPAVELAGRLASGCMTAVYNAANEAAAALLAIGFPAIVGIIADVLHAADQWARRSRYRG